VTSAVGHELPERARQLEAVGARVISPEGGFAGALRSLWDEGISSLVLEGGAALHGAALEAGVVDAMDLYIAPRRLGPGALPWIGEGRFSWPSLANRRATWLGEDLLVEGTVSR
jgi:diaminohydroxyphosphoribosylaminopyrimidine deaminase/5-amino-6-(5-phosphoribosylamino)uracil reductase